MALAELFETQVKKNPQATAILFGDQSITYAQLNQKANQLAHYLRELGVKPDTPVAICMERSIELLIAIFGILKAGGAYIPLDPSHPEKRLCHLLKEGNTAFLITTNHLQSKFTSYEGQIISIENEAQIRTQQIDNPQSLAAPANLAYIIYTSGSTGMPKGVLIEQQGVIDYLHWFADFCDCHPYQRIDFSSNHAFDFALTTSLVPLMLGLTVVMCSDSVKKDMRQYLEYLKINKVTFIKLTPSYFRVLLHEIQNRHIDLPDLKKIMLAGENLPAVDCSSWLTHYPDHILFNEYGPTETSIAVFLHKIASQSLELEGKVPIGAPAPYVQMYLLDEDRSPVVDGEVGELYLGGSCLARGYLNNPDLTERYFIKNPFSEECDARLYKTGDLCRRLPHGEIECIGRVDYQLKIRGFRVEPGEIEHCLMTHPAVKNAVVTTFDLSPNEKKLVAYYILNDKANASEQQLRDYLQRYLPDYMIPVNLVRMEAFPLNANEKLDRSALPEPQFAASQHYHPTSTLMEKKLATIWSGELGINPIGLNDDFFELGGHSLSAARIISIINHQFGKEVRLSDFYQKPTIAQLAILIESTKETGKKRLSLNKTFYNTTMFPLGDFQLLMWLADTFEPKAKKINMFSRKRIAGRPNLLVLQSALNAVLKKHEVLSYHISTFRPMQHFEKNLTFNLVEKNLQSLSSEEAETALERSTKQLINTSQWPKNNYAIRIRVFYLNEGSTEIQLAIPHILSEDVSVALFWDDFSAFYLSADKAGDTIERDKSYRSYLYEEQNYIKNNFKRDLSFWENYLKNATLFAFPTKYLIKNRHKGQYALSTYQEIPEKTLNEFQHFCKLHHVSILDGLCAVLLLALFNCCRDQISNNTICINRVKSTRDNPEYDKTLGCFLRIEPVKLTIDKNPTVTSLLEQILQSVATTHIHQRFSSLGKLASIGTFQHRKNILKSRWIKLLVWFYALIFRLTPVHRELFKLSWRLNTAKGNNFLVNVNVQKSFWERSEKKESSTILGFPIQKIVENRHDVLTINNMFDVCFRRFAETNTPFIVLSANLDPAFRELIANEILNIMDRVC